MNTFKLVIITGLAFLMSHQTLARTFSHAKKQAAVIYLNQQKTFYSACDYYAEGKKLRPDWASCGFTPRKNANRASRIEWEHVMPAWNFGHQRLCWQAGGRRNCRRDSVFTEMESDLHNLVPAIGEINGDRSNYKYGLITGEERVYGTVDAEVSFKDRIFEPKPDIRGDIARTYFYMRDQYDIRLSKQQTRLLHIWNRQDPVDNWERERNWHIQSVQGNANTFISDAYDTGFSCQTGKQYCSEMNSCDEAKFNLYQCGKTGLDGNNDGIPCNSLCR